MHIKSLKISGFKSYKDQVTQDEDFSEGFNVIVGRNGAGKSNLFSAIVFCLMADERLHTLSAKQRQHVLHSGTGAGVINAYVEVTFDNSDGRLPIDEPEVALRRSIGVKKDEFFVNKKHYTKTEVVNMLETAGFSQSNPYYIVRQDSVARLSQMKPNELFDVMKEVAGTKVYEQRRHEALKMMSEAENQLVEVNGLLGGIDSKLEELQDERKELDVYMNLDRERRALEYSIYAKKQREMVSQIERIDAQLAEARRKDSEEDEVKDLVDQREGAEDRLRGIDADLVTTGKQLGDARLDQEKYTAEVARLDVALRDARAAASDADERRATLDADIEEAEAEIADKRAELAKGKPTFDKAVAAEGKADDSLRTAQSSLNALQNKAGRNKQFKTVKERDAYLKKELKDVDASLSRRLAKVDEQEKELKGLEKRGKKASEDRVRHSKAVQDAKQSVDRLVKERQAATNANFAASDERKRLWKELDGLEKTAAGMKESSWKHEQALLKTTDRPKADAIRMLDDIKANVDGVHGLLMELMDPSVFNDPQFWLALESAAGDKLLELIVADKKAASAVTAYLARKGAGRITCVPLQDLAPTTIASYRHDDVITLWDLVAGKKDGELVKKYGNAFQYAFARTLCARTLDVANKVAKNHDTTCVTLEGDKVERKGAITGGWKDKSASRIRSYSEMSKAKGGADRAKADIERVNAQLTAKDHAITSDLNTKSRIEAEQASNRKALEEGSTALAASESESTVVEEETAERSKMLDTLNGGVREDQERKAALETEMKTEMVSKLSVADTATLAALHKSVTKLEAVLAEASDKRMSLEANRAGAESEVNQNLLKRRTQLQTELNALTDAAAKGSSQGSGGGGMVMSQGGGASGGKGGATTVAGLVAELEGIQQQLKRCAVSYKEAQKLHNELTYKKEHEAKACEELSDTANKLSGKAAQDAASMMQIVTDRAAAIRVKDEMRRKIQEIGSLPSMGAGSGLEKTDGEFLRMTEKDLRKKLNAANEKLKKFAHVNKKAADQYSTFMEHRTALVARRDNGDQERDSIERLVDHLDLKKDNALALTMKQVSKNFESVFQQLVIGGKALLKLESSGAPAVASTGRGGKKAKKKGGGGKASMDDDSEDEDDDDVDVGSKRKMGAKGKKPAKKKASSKKSALSDDEDDEDEDDDDEEEEEEDGRKKKGGSLKDVENFDGVTITVSFTKTSGTMRMQQLSGGQKSIVALALVFAIQRSDPAPFYLFDELDANMDPQYRTAVANLIEEQADPDSDVPGQFICTTFRTELVSKADKHFMVTHKNKISTFAACSQDDAVSLVMAEEKNEEEAQRHKGAAH